jgi:hypothetical protein
MRAPIRSAQSRWAGEQVGDALHARQKSLEPEHLYAEQVGFDADHDVVVSDEIRRVQLTPPGSACSIALGTGISDAPPGRARAQLVVSDIHAALAGRGVEVGAVAVVPWGEFVFFSDPDGNRWSVQRARPARSSAERAGVRERAPAALGVLRGVRPHERPVVAQLGRAHRA